MFSLQDWQALSFGQSLQSHQASHCPPQVAFLLEGPAVLSQQQLTQRVLHVIDVSRREQGTC